MMNALGEGILFVALLTLTTIKVTFLTLNNLIFTLFPRRRKSIADDIILITGGGKGIGRQMALKFASLKPKHIIIWGRNDQPLKQTAEDVRSKGVECSYFACDVSNREDVYHIADSIKSSIGDVTILINNAGVFTGALFVDDTEDNVQKTLAINALAHIWTYKAFLPGMISQDRGHIVTISSMLGIMPLRGATSYCSSKYATTGMSESLFLELEEYPNIHLTSVHSYQVANDMFKGLKLRFPWLIPPLSEDYVAECTIKAVLTNKKIIMMPRLMYLLVPCLSLFPTRTMVPLLKFIGVSSALDQVILKNR